MRQLVDHAAVWGRNPWRPVFRVGRAKQCRRGLPRQWATVLQHLKNPSIRPKNWRSNLRQPLNRLKPTSSNTCNQLKLSGQWAVRRELHLYTFHMNIEEKCQGEAIRRAGKRLGHFHACGSDRGTPGNDHINWDCITRALHQIGYTGDVVIESFTTEVKVIAKAAAIWRRIEPTRDEIAVKGLQFLRRQLGVPADGSCCSGGD